MNHDSDDDLDPEEEAGYRLKIPKDPHGLQERVGILLVQPNAADVAPKGNEAPDDEDNPNIVPPLVPRSNDTDSESEDDTCSHDGVPIVKIISNLVRYQRRKTAAWNHQDDQEAPPN